MADPAYGVPGISQMPGRGWGRGLGVQELLGHLLL